MTVENITQHIESITPSTFSIVDHIAARAYAEDDLPVILNDKIGHEWERLNLEAATISDTARLKEIDARLEELRDEAKKYTYILHFKGISEKAREDILEQSVQQHPREFDEYINPLSGQKVREEKESPERDRLNTHLIWAAHIDKITAPDGAVQDYVSVEDATAIRSAAPYSALVRIQQIIEELRVATTWQDQVINEDF